MFCWGVFVALSRSILQFSLSSFMATKSSCCTFSITNTHKKKNISSGENFLKFCSKNLVEASGGTYKAAAFTSQDVIHVKKERCPLTHDIKFYICWLFFTIPLDQATSFFLALLQHYSQTQTHHDYTIGIYHYQSRVLQYNEKTYQITDLWCPGS